MKIDLSKLSFEELTQLQTDIEIHKESRKDMRVYKVTFYIGFNANQHDYDDLSTPKAFGDYFADSPTDLLFEYFYLEEPENVSECNVVELKPEEFPEMFKNTK
jgi:hypothetical protein